MSGMTEPLAEQYLEGERATVFVPGFGLIYEDTGDLVEPDGETPDAAQQLFRNTGLPVEFDSGTVDWALGKMFELDADITEKSTAMKARIEAIKGNYEPVVKRAQRARKRFEELVAPALAAYASRELDIRNRKRDGTPVKNPEKTIKTMFGSLAFRKHHGNPEAVCIKKDGKAADALRVVQEHFPHAIKMVPQIDWDAFTEQDKAKIREQAKFTTATDFPLEVIDAVPAGDTFHIKTGVQAK